MSNGHDRSSSASGAASPDAERPVPEAHSALLDLLTEASHELVCRLGADLTVLYASPSAARVVGVDAAELLGSQLDRWCHEEDLPALLASCEMARDSEDESKAVFRFRTPEGQWRWCEIYFRGGGRSGMRCTLLDVTRFKRIEQAIERVAREWRSTFDAAHDAILMLDAQGVVLRVNRSTLSLLGCEFQDVVGQSLADVTLERLSLVDPFGLQQVWRTARQERRDIELAGRSLWARSTLDPILLANGEIGGAVLFLADITSEKRAELRLRSTLDEVRRLSSRLRDFREQERRSLAREVHDELGHALTALKMDIAWLVKRIPESQPDVLERGSELLAMVDRTVAATRRLVSRLRPPVLDDLGLDAALEWLVSDFQRHSGITVSAELDGMPRRLRSDGATALFHIVQEALTNVMRHAQATRVTVRWEEDSADGYRLSIEDNGRGFDRESADFVAGFGLLGITERVHDLGGEHQIISAPGEGTRLVVTVPTGVIE